MTELTDKQQRFCEEYLIDLNAKQAAIRAGYSEDSAKEMGYENLTKPHLQDYISELKKKTAKRLEITRERVLKEYARVAFADIRQFYDENGRLLTPHSLDDDAAAALAGIEVYEEFGFDKTGEKAHIGDTKKIKLCNKLAALNDIAKHLGLFEEDNKQKNPDLDISNLTTEEKYQYLMLRNKARLNVERTDG